MKRLILIVLLAVSGCDSTPSPLVRIVHVERQKNPDSSLYTMQGDYTVVEDIETGNRRMVPGVWGEAEDEFRLGKIWGELK